MVGDYVHIGIILDNQADQSCYSNLNQLLHAFNEINSPSMKTIYESDSLKTSSRSSEARW